MTTLFLLVTGLSATGLDGTTTIRVDSAPKLRSALAAAKPGDVIAVAPGVYPGGFSGSGLKGTAERPIAIVAADPASPPVFRGGSAAFHLSRVAHVRLEDLVVEGCTGNGINIDDGGDVPDAEASHVRLQRLRIKDVGPDGNRDGIKLSGVSDFTVEDCVVERWGSGGSGVDMVGCRRGAILSCEFRHEDGKGGEGVQAKGGSSDIVVRGCRFRHAGGRGVNLGGNTGAAYFRPKSANYEAKNITVENCDFVGSTAPIAFVGVDGALVRRNVFYRPRRWAVRILQENRTRGFVAGRNGRFEENVVVFRSDELSVAVNVGDSTEPESFRFAKNLWFCLDAPGRSRPRLPVQEVGGRYGVDPRLKSPETGDLRPGIDVGDVGPSGAK